MLESLADSTERKLASDLRSRFGGEAEAGVPLSRVSQWRVGGPADVLFQPPRIQELQNALAWLSQRGIPVTVVGMTTNLLFSTRGVRGVVVQVAKGLGGIEADGEQLRVGGGVWVPQVALFAMHAKLGGLEHICGIPGSFGGLVSMNGGSLRRSISENLLSIDVVSRDGARRTFPVEACEFAYRSSRFQSTDDVIVECRLRLAAEAEPGPIRRRMMEILRARRRFPRKQPNCGSVFVSDPQLYETFGAPGKVIEALGFKGFRVGGAVVSPEHANFIINTGGATAEDVLEVIDTIRRRVLEATGCLMRVEARYVREDGGFVAAEGLEVIESTS